jgi:glyoxylase-like metal-dependent hydrolase (beta-lactamase superfamily II)
VSDDPGGGPAYGTPRTVSARAAVVLARNPSPMTLEGTNTWLLRAPEQAGRQAVVVDPGPDDVAHADAVLAAAGAVVRILLTHGHPDHSDGARRMHERTGAPVSALDPRWCFGGEGLHEGDVVAAAGIELRVWATAGHTADSLSFVLAGDDGGAGEGSAAGDGGSRGDGVADRVGEAVLTGDTVLGRGSTVIAEPDGNLAAYLASLRRLDELGSIAVLPGHGPELPDARASARAGLAHRRQRLDQVRGALARLGLDPVPASAAAVVGVVYADVDRRLWPAAEQSVRAQLAYLRSSWPPRGGPIPDGPLRGWAIGLGGPDVRGRG